ncbi:MAG: sorbosone dehydrogenase family protein [Vicinamibacteria bacterium]
MALTGCASASRAPVSDGTGATPRMPTPVHSAIPTINVVTAIGWSPNATPLAAGGLSVVALARGLEHPRWLYVLPNGDVLVAETNAPKRPDDSKGIRGWFFNRFQKKAGGAVPSPDRITLLRDTDGDGVADVRTVFRTGLTSPFGMVLVDHDFYVADTDALVRLPYETGATSLSGPLVKVVDLPAGPLNHHWTKNVVASADGSSLYVAIGSNSNAGDKGIEKEKDRADIWKVDPKTGEHRVFASGLRNPVGMAWEPKSGALWTAVNERDELGNDLVPDYMTSVRDGGFYGFPYSYFGNHVDTRVKPQRPDLVATALVPDYALGAHTASLGLASAVGSSLGERFANGMFVGQHGSWNRKPRSGYKVIFVPFVDGRPVGEPLDVLTGFVTPDGRAMGRPVGVAVAKDGSLLVADDVGNAVWRISATSKPRK